jgi:hypothetical protein
MKSLEKIAVGFFRLLGDSLPFVAIVALAYIFWH